MNVTLSATARSVASMLFCACSITTLMAAPTLPDGGTPGFTEAYFDMASLRQLTDDEECTALRFYNVMGSNGSGTVMVIGIRSDGSEINGGLFARPYKISNGIIDRSVNITDVSRSSAERACTDLANAGHTSYSATFSKASIQPILDDEQSNVITIRYADQGGTQTMSLTPGMLDGNTVLDMEGGLICTDPCPVVCGPLTNYINVR